MATLVTRCCRKTNRLQSVQGYGKQRTHKIFTSPRNRKKCCHGNTCYTKKSVAEKLISSSLCRGMESKDSIKIFASQKKEKSVAGATLVARCCRKANQLQSVQGYGKQRTHKNIYKSKKPKKVLPWQHLLPGLPKNLSAPVCAGVWKAKNP